MAPQAGLPASLEARDIIVTVTSTSNAQPTSVAAGSSPSSPVPVAAIVGGLVGGIAGGLLLAGLVYCCTVRRVRKRKEAREAYHKRRSRLANSRRIPDSTAKSMISTSDRTTSSGGSTLVSGKSHKSGWSHKSITSDVSFYSVGTRNSHVPPSMFDKDANATQPPQPTPAYSGNMADPFINEKAYGYEPNPTGNVTSPVQTHSYRSNEHEPTLQLEPLQTFGMPTQPQAALSENALRRQAPVVPSSGSAEVPLKHERRKSAPMQTGQTQHRIRRKSAPSLDLNEEEALAASVAAQDPPAVLIEHRSARGAQRAAVAEKAASAKTRPVSARHKPTRPSPLSQSGQNSVENSPPLGYVSVLPPVNFVEPGPSLPASPTSTRASSNPSSPTSSISAYEAAAAGNWGIALGDPEHDSQDYSVNHTRLSSQGRQNLDQYQRGPLPSDSYDLFAEHDVRTFGHTGGVEQLRDAPQDQNAGDHKVTRWL